MSDVLLTEDLGAVRVLRLNRPDALNAFNTPLSVALRAALEGLAGATEVRCLVLTGAGRGFSAGQDLSDPLAAPNLEPGAPPKDLSHLLDHYGHPLALALRHAPVPVVVAVNGIAAGAGASLALGGDIVIAGESASFLQAFSKIGLIPDAGGTWLLPHLVGRAKALELAMLAEKLPAAEAARLGLISRVVPDAELMDTALAVAQRLAAMPTRALVETRRAIDAAMQLDFEATLQRESRTQSQLGFAHDYLEGAAAFLQKRKPVFKDR
jgi:2-(1,2-epoxy-1,2-dihydrophenyl)acetyl-CoA isomerase